jgi:hypothetical protein
VIVYEGCIELNVRRTRRLAIFLGRISRGKMLLDVFSFWPISDL